MFFNRVKKVSKLFTQLNVRFQRPTERDEWQKTFPWPLPKGYTITYRYSPDQTELVFECVPLEEAKAESEIVDTSGEGLPAEWEAERKRLSDFPIQELRVMCRELNLQITNKMEPAELVDKIVNARREKQEAAAADASTK